MLMNTILTLTTPYTPSSSTAFVALSTPSFTWVAVTFLLALVVWLLLLIRHGNERSRKLIQDLQEQDERWRQALEGIGDGLWDWDIPSGKVIFSSRWSIMLGYSPHEIQADVKEWSQRVHPEDLPHAMEQVQAHLDGHTASYACEHRVRCKDGSWKWILDRGQIVERDSNQRPIRMVGTHVDITETKLLEEELRESKQLVEGIMNAIPVRVFWKDTDLRYLGCNVRFAQDAGFESPNQLIGRDDFQMSWKAQAARYRQDDQQVITTGLPKLLIEEPLTMPSGQVITLLTSKLPLRNAQGEISGVLGTYIDQTEYQRAEEARDQLEIQNRQLQKAESLGRMAGAIAHHVNNQLQAITTCLELVLADTPPTGSTAQLLSTALSSTLKAANVSGLMLTYIGQTHCEAVPCDLSDVCQTHLPMLKASLPPNAHLKVEIPTPGPAIKANSNQIHQLLTNLITNAWEALEGRPGDVQIRVYPVPDTAIPSSDRFPIGYTTHQAHYACLEVRDTGSGIPAQSIDQIFDPFFSSKFTGRGMGLSVVLSIVRAHGGTIVVDSKPGTGSRFCVFFPCIDPSSVASTAPATAPLKSQPAQVVRSNPAPSTATLLVVEDEPVVRNSVARLLTSLGFSVLTAEDGVEALRTFQTHPGVINCVLCDLSMPRMDGWETLTALRKLQPSLPIILCSGFNECDAMAGSHTELPQEFLSKPYSATKLVDVLGRMLGRPIALEPYPQP